MAGENKKMKSKLHKSAFNGYATAKCGYFAPHGMHPIVKTFTVILNRWDFVTCKKCLKQKRR